MDDRDKEPAKGLMERYFQGRSIPYTVLVDSSGEVHKTWTGYLSFSDLVSEIAAVEASIPKSENVPGDE